MQPFNKRISYGLSFIKFHIKESVEDKTGQLQKEMTMTKQNVEDDEDFRPGSLFAKRQVCLIVS